MNTALRRAKQEKNDEYYTLLEDIENELTHYPNQFKIIGFSSQLAQPTRVNGHKVTTDFVIDNVRKYSRVVIQAQH